MQLYFLLILIAIIAIYSLLLILRFHEKVIMKLFIGICNFDGFIRLAFRC